LTVQREADVVPEKDNSLALTSPDYAGHRAIAATRAGRVRRAGALALVLLVWLAGCGSKITQENFDQVHTGMSQDEVTAILGKPTESSSVSFGALSGGSWIWKKNGAMIAIQFANGKVLAKQFTQHAP
jgi:hypothetical protein